MVTVKVEQWSFEELLIVPNAPIDTDESAIERSMGALGIRLPHDYLLFCDKYGSGSVFTAGKRFELISAGRVTYPDFVRDFSERQGQFRDAMETHDVGLGLYPEKGGLLPFGKDDSGTYFCWDTHSSPDEWTVVVIWEYEDDGFKRLNCSYSGFVCGLLKGSQPHPLWGKKWKPILPVDYLPEIFSC
ncbi:MAG: hypothetical protein Tsb009_35380 [Planctomycetaceae bacterium]